MTWRRAALSGASDTLRDALAALSGSTPTQAQLTAARNALTALNTAISEGGDLTDAEKAPYVLVASNAAAPISSAQMAFNNAENEGENNRNKAMAATAAKLFAGLEHPPSDDADAESRRHAAYGGTDGDDIVVTFGATADATTATLTLDEDETVAARHGWTGQKFAASPDGGGTYEAVVYSNVREPMEGAKFSTQYMANLSDGTLDESTTETGGPERIASSRFDQSAGVKSFDLPSNTVAVMIAGSYHGVPGTYSCAPGTDNKCASQRAAMGFTLGTVDVPADGSDPTFTAEGGTWTFKPTNPDARLMDTPNDAYASYGWWLHTAANGDLTASAFHDRRGADADSVSITGAGANILQGTATYTGGAAGKYALSNALGGPNIAGHFTANVELNAKFGAAAEVTGMVDNFVTEHDNDWEVSLNKASLPATGGIEAEGTDKPATTTWKIGGTGDGTGDWSGMLYGGTATKAPDEGTGTFTAIHGRNARMVGAFGVTEKK